eukprot:IDg5951t1
MVKLEQERSPTFELSRNWYCTASIADDGHRRRREALQLRYDKK